MTAGKTELRRGVTTSSHKEKPIAQIKDNILMAKEEVDANVLVDLTGDDSDDGFQGEELALKLEIEQRAARAAELKLKMLKLWKKH